MKVLIVGSGAREHALAWKLARSPLAEVIYVAPGNPGTGKVARNVPIAVTDVESIVRFVEERDIDLTVIGPEAPLALGLADRLQAAGKLVLGPERAAARLEWSKSFAKTVMEQAGVPTAPWKLFDDPAEARHHLSGAIYPLVIKADGLAAGKGVWVCGDRDEAQRAVNTMMVDGVFGDAGRRIVVEEALSGPEVSLIALTDGERVAPFPIAQDHKRLLDGDRGPNTGGMGAYAPVPFLDANDVAYLSRLVLEPVIRAMAEAGMPYRGVLFAGLMLTERGPHVLEYNCRLGDPEAQVILPLVEGDLLPSLADAASGRLSGTLPALAKSAAGVVLAAAGYPDAPRTGTPIEGFDEVGDVLVFHAGTALDGEGQIVTAGGRVLTVVGTGDTVAEAVGKAYAAPIYFEGMQRRGDIGRQALAWGMADRGLSSIQLGGRTAGQSRPRIGVLASGEGSNLQALLDATRGDELNAEVAVVVSHREGAGALERARRGGVPAFTLPIDDPREPEARYRLEDELLALLAGYELDLLVLAGWMLILSERFLDAGGCPVLNVHPALLPWRTGDRTVDGTGHPILRGARCVRDAIRLDLPYTGVSVHLVTPEVDAGPVIRRETVPIEPGDTEASLYARIKPVEHRLLVAAVGDLLRSPIPGGVHA